MDIFDQWISARLSSGSKVPPDDLLRSQDGKIVCEWLCRFFTEVRKLKEIFTLANLNADGISNHSLRTTSISRMYHAKVPEKLIMERSGHLSKEGVRSYERMSSKQIQSICKTLSASTVENSEDSSKENAIPQHCFDSPSSKAKINQDSDEETKTKEASDTLKQMNFQGLSGCTFNINMYSH